MNCEFNYLKKKNLKKSFKIDKRNKKKNIEFYRTLTDDEFYLVVLFSNPMVSQNTSVWESGYGYKIPIAYYIWTWKYSYLWNLIYCSA